MGIINIWNKKKLFDLIKDGLRDNKLILDSDYREELFNRSLEVKEIREMLQGYKTYIIVALGIAVNVAAMMGYIDEATRNSLLALLGTGAVGTVAAKLNRINNR